MLAIKKNLTDQTGTDDVTIMHCTVCGGVYSANAGDYWAYPDDHEFQCCGRTMVLGEFKRVFVPKER